MEKKEQSQTHLRLVTFALKTMSRTRDNIAQDFEKSNVSVGTLLFYVHIIMCIECTDNR